MHCGGQRRRRAIVTRLERGTATVGVLAAPFQISRPAISKHLDVLEHAGLIRRVRVGRESRCRLNAAALKPVDTWVSRYRRHWTERLDALVEYLENEESTS
ncbi:MAG: ArsR/SmtB family transcription factor [Longimicrobiales bacterium]